MSPGTDPGDTPGLPAIAALYALLAWFFAVAGPDSGRVLALCLLPFAAALALLHVTTPPVARRAYAMAAVVLLLGLGGIVTGSRHPQAAQLWWLHAFSVALAAVGTGLDATVLNRLRRRETTLPRAVLATLMAGLLPTALLLYLSSR
jgi:hypothetical protein